MTHVQIKNNGKGALSLIVDGIDLSRSVLAEGFNVTIEPGSDGAAAYVTMTVRADTLDADLPESVLIALRAERAERAER